MVGSQVERRWTANPSIRGSIPLLSSKINEEEKVNVMTVSFLQMYKESILEILVGSDITVENLDYAFAITVVDLLDEDFIADQELSPEQILESLQNYKRAYGELVLEHE